RCPATLPSPPAPRAAAGTVRGHTQNRPPPAPNRSPDVGTSATALPPAPGTAAGVQPPHPPIVDEWSAPVRRPPASPLPATRPPTAAPAATDLQFQRWQEWTMPPGVRRATPDA